MYKYIKTTIISFFVLTFALLSCDGMYDSLNDYSGEIIYPAKYDTVIGKIGFNRVEIDLLKAGRIPTSKIAMGKSKKTLVEYDDTTLVLDTVASWLNIKNLTSPKLYRFYIYTIDEYENKSVPQEIALIPYTESDLATLTVANPKITYSTTSAVLEWESLSSVLLDYIAMTCKYVDKNGKEQTIEVKEGESTRVTISNLEAKSTVNVDITYQVNPKIDGVNILDVLPVKRTVTLYIPDKDTPFSTIDEQSILEKNGIKTFTANGVKGIKKLVYPIITNSLQDIFYFPDLEELDLTGGDLFPTTSLTYKQGASNESTVGAKGILEPFMRKVSPIASSKTLVLKELLEKNMLKKVTYIPHSMGIDDILEPYVKTGVVELVDMPETALISNDFILNETVQTTAWEIIKEYPAKDAPAGTGKETYKITLKSKNSTFTIAIPKEYRFNTEVYKYLEMEVYSPPKSVLTGDYSKYNRLWLRTMNYLWAFTSHSDFGQETWQDESYYLKDNELEKWTTIKFDISKMNDRHTRVIAINFGGEPSITFAPKTPIVYYISDMRFIK